MEIYPLFSKVIYLDEVPDIFFDEYESLKYHYKLHNTSLETEKCSKASENLYVLDDFPKLKETILDIFLDFKRNVFNYFDTNFEMSTSWVTKTEKNSQSEYHIHKNSYYSGVLYLNDEDSSDQIGKLEFMDSNSNQITPNDPREYNIYNSTTWAIKPKKNLLVFFPSDLHHKITIHGSENPRYSVAFNFFPINKFGLQDSQLNIKSLK